MIKITTEIKMPAPGKSPYTAPNLFEKVSEFINLCECGEASEFHFKYLKSLYKKLNNKPNLPSNLKELMETLTEFMTKHAGNDSGEDQLDVDGVDIFKYQE
jgi:hypothetical protein